MNAKIVGGRPATLAETSEAEQLRQIGRIQLATIRSAAANWRNGVGMSGTIAAVATMVATPDVISAASKQAVFNGGWLLAIGALFTAASILLAMLASFGWPATSKISGTGELRAWEERAQVRARWQLQFSMSLALVGLCCFFTAIAILVFGVPFFFDFPGWGK